MKSNIIRNLLILSIFFKQYFSINTNIHKNINTIRKRHINSRWLFKNNGEKSII